MIHTMPLPHLPQRGRHNAFVAQCILDQFPEGYRGHCVDVGASDGISINSTWMLEKAYFWTVVSVEPIPVFHDFLSQERAMVEKCALGSRSEAEATFHIYQAIPEAYSSLNPDRKALEKHRDYPKEGISWEQIKVPVKTLDEVLERWDFPKLDALCIDVEGTEVDVLKGLDIAKWLPKVIVAECWEEPVEIQKHIGPHGYQRRFKSVDNHIWIRGEHSVRPVLHVEPVKPIEEDQ